MSTLTTDDSRALPPQGNARAASRRLHLGEDIAYVVVFVAAAMILLITGLISYELWVQSAVARHKFGFLFLFTSNWDPIAGQFGALPFIYGTVITSALALTIAIPQGIGSAIFLAELAPRKISNFLAFLIELLAAVPSVIYGLLGIFILVPFLQANVVPWLKLAFGF